MKNAALSFLIIVVCAGINSCKQHPSDKIKNGIEIQENGLHIEEAFLTNGDSIIINEDNKVQIGELICLRLTIKGWTEDSGKVFMDAFQKVTTSSGITLAINPSIFGSNLMKGIVPVNANRVLLYQKIGKVPKRIDYVLINFKVWDKTSNKSVSGSYKIHVD